MSRSRYYDDLRTNDSSQSPARSSSVAYNNSYPIRDESFYDFYDPDAFLRLKWLDNSPRMSRLRDHRQKRLINRLEV